MLAFIPNSYDISKFLEEGSTDTYVFCAPEVI